MSDLYKMVGTPWHTEKMVRAEGDDRRHRSRCENYDKKAKRCCQTLSGCYGAAHCQYYKERESDEENGTSECLQSNSKQNVLSSEQRGSVLQLKREGTMCKHKTFGKGEVVGTVGKYSLIRFERGDEKKIDTEFAIRNRIIELL